MTSAYLIRAAKPDPVLFTGQGKVYQIPRRCQEKGPEERILRAKIFALIYVRSCFTTKVMAPPATAQSNPETQWRTLNPSFIPSLYPFSLLMAALRSDKLRVESLTDLSISSNRTLIPSSLCCVPERDCRMPSVTDSTVLSLVSTPEIFSSVALVPSSTRSRAEVPRSYSPLMAILQTAWL